MRVEEPSQVLLDGGDLVIGDDLPRQPDPA
jgi:hypothetical protein